MKIYNYNPITFEYTGSQNADLDPQETKEQGKNVYLLPANATFIKPPESEPMKVRVFKEGSWSYEKDFRKGFYKVDSSLVVTEITELGDIPDGYILVTETIGDDIKVNPEKYIIDDGVIREKTEEEKQAEEEKEFNEQFFRTSLGYVRRTVTMKDGSTKDFLTDILPLLVVGVPVLVYSRELKQTRIQATEPFINECKQQLFVDFYGGDND